MVCQDPICRLMGVPHLKIIEYDTHHDQRDDDEYPYDYLMFVLAENGQASEIRAHHRHADRRKLMEDAGDNARANASSTLLR